MLFQETMKRGKKILKATVLKKGLNNCPIFAKFGKDPSKNYLFYCK